MLYSFSCTTGLVIDVNSMQINNRSIQDMYIFGDPLRVPIVIVERMTSTQRSNSVNSYFIPLEEKAKSTSENQSRATNMLSASSPQQNEHVLRVVVFVHGFQVCFMFLHLSLYLKSEIFLYFISSLLVILWLLLRQRMIVLFLRKVKQLCVILNKSENEN